MDMIKRLGEICNIVSGGTPSRTQTKFWENGNIPWIKIGDIKSKYVNEANEHITQEGLDGSSAKLLQKGTILYTIFATLGEVGILTIEACTNQAIAGITIKNQEEVLPDYLYYYLKSKKAHINEIGRGVAQNNINMSILRGLNVPLPSVQNQQKIAEILDMISNLIVKHKQQLEKLDELIKARFVEMFGNIAETVPLSYYISAVSAGKSLAGEEECSNKVLKTGAATYDYFDSTQIKNLPVDYEPQEEHRVNTGDVIISRMNTSELVGAAAYVWEAPKCTYLPDRLWRAEIKDTACPIFVWQVLIQSSTKESIRRIASGTSGSMKNISKPGLLGIRVNKVPLELQNQFATFVKQIDKSKVVVQKALDEAQLLFDSKMQEYFG